MKNIAVIFGGKSVEHDISVITALQTMQNVPSKYKMIPIYIKSDGSMVTADNLMDAKIFLDYQNMVKRERDVLPVVGKGKFAICRNGKVKASLKIDAALLCTHGHGGEDGSLQGLLELCQIPYSSPSVASSALCMDKVLTKIMLSSKNIENPAYVHFDRREYKANKDKISLEICNNIGFPCIIKPTKLGSSVGIGICEDEATLDDVLEDAFCYDNDVLVEKYLSNAREFCCAVINVGEKFVAGKVSEVDKGEIYTFDEKYINKSPRLDKEIEKNLIERVRRKAVESYRTLRCDGVVRVDFLYEESKDILYVNELNTIPGSLSFNMFDTSFEDLIEILISSAEEKQQREAINVYSFSSSAIESYINLVSNSKIGK